METKVQKLYRAALKKGDVMEAIRLLHYKPAKAKKELVVAKKVVAEAKKEVPSKKKKLKKE